MKINFSKYFQSLSDKYGACEALVNSERNRRYTFTEYHLLTNRIANMLRDQLGLKKGDSFINILENDNLSLLHLPTIFKSDVTGAFTNYREPLSEHLWQIECAQAKVVFIEGELVEDYYPEIHGRGLKLISMDPVDEPREGLYYFWDLVEASSDANSDIELDDREHTALIRFTGGTTGMGKPAKYCIDNWLACRDSFYAFPDSDWNDSRMLHLAPISHGSGLMFLAPLFQGGCNVTQNVADLGEYCKNLENERITHAFLVPTLLYRLLELSEAAEADLTSLHTVFYGAAPMSAGKLKLLQERFGNIFVQVYGSTENLAIALSLCKKDHIIDSNVGLKRLSSAGQITSSVEVMIADDNGKPVAKGEAGELWLRSRGICQGYLNNPEKTAEEFINGYWKSGDIAMMDDEGYVTIVDRKKDMIISGGFNIYANEVEAVVNAYKGVLMSAVVGIPHEEWGEMVHAEIVLNEGVSLNEAELVQFVKDKLGGFKAPRSIAVVDELPISSAGKVLRRKVRDQYWKEAGRSVG